jgi:hypothetical protein
MSKPYVKKIEYLYENQKSRRQLKITLSNKRTIRAESCHESWEQWGGSTDDLYISMPTVEQHNDWLHGGERP